MSMENKGVGSRQKLVTAYPIDKSSAGTVGDSSQARHGNKMAGGPHNLSHSLGGASVVGQSNTKKNRFT